MSTCPRCRAPLAFDGVLQLGPDDYSDDFAFKLFHCTKCPLVGAGSYEESRRGSGESWHHTGYELARTDYDRLARDIAACPAPQSKGCACASHRRYRSDTTHDPLAGIPKLGNFFTLG